MATKDEVIEQLIIDFGYTREELEKDWNFIQVEADNDLNGNVYFDGKYVLFHHDKVIWY